MHTDLTFFTNEPGCTLLDRFKRTLNDVHYFDILVGYFRSSGFYHLYQSFEHIDKIRILVGLSIDKKTYQVIESVRQKVFDFEAHATVQKIFEKALLEEVETSADRIDIEEGIRKFCEFIEMGKIEIKAHPSRNLHAKVYISRYKDASGRVHIEVVRMIIPPYSLSHNVESDLILNIDKETSPYPIRCGRYHPQNCRTKFHFRECQRGQSGFGIVASPAFTSQNQVRDF